MYILDINDKTKRFKLVNEHSSIQENGSFTINKNGERLLFTDTIIHLKELTVLTCK